MAFEDDSSAVAGGRSEDQEMELEAMGYFFMEDDELEMREPSASCPTRMRVKVSPEEAERFMWLDIGWPKEYPEVVPELSLDDPHNQILPKQHRIPLLERLQTLAEESIGENMTIALVSALRDEMEALEDKFVGTSLWDAADTHVDESQESMDAEEQPFKPWEKEAKLTKQQKRRLFDQGGASGERPEGWNWVDIISHLSKTGVRAS